MKLDTSMQLEQKLKLNLTQQMKLSLEILQETTLEIEERVNRELEENPLLERSEPSEETRPSDNFRGMEFFVTAEDGLRDVLREQVVELNLPERESLILNRMIEYVDDTGYLGRYHLDDFFQQVDEDTMEKCLFFLQDMEPKGVGARSLKECLLLQIKAKDWLLEPIHRIVADHLEDLGNGRHRYIMEKLELDAEEFESQLELLYELDPKPGLNFKPVERSDYILPDIYLKLEQGKMQIQLNERSYPELTLSQLYNDTKGMDQDTLSYIRYKRKQAQFLIDALRQRRETILKVMEEIIHRQHSFFFEDGGIHYLTREDIARAVNMHNSTVSRAVQGKYLYWKNQSWALNDFFPKGIVNEDGTAISNNSVKILIASMIEQENSKRPLSDEKIKKRLHDMKIEISRRTVAKYRDELHIPNSSRRRR